MNSLYGKFFQSVQGDRVIKHIDNLTTEEIQDYIKTGYKESIVGEDNQWRYYDRVDYETSDIPKFIIPIFATYVTAYARTELFNNFSDNVIYCDTDSVVTTDKIKSGKELGEWDMEQEIKQGVFVRPKFYYYENKNGDIFLKVKGVRGITLEEFNSSLDNKTPFSFTKFAGFTMCNRKYNGTFHSYNEIIDITKYYDPNDTKRVWECEQFNRFECQESKPIYINYGDVI